MNISAYIMANRSQEVPIPVPGTPIECTISAGSMTVHFTSTDGKSPEEITDKTESYPLIPVTWYQNEGAIPCNYHCDYSLYSNSSWEKGFWIESVKGSITYSGLTPGKYVSVHEFYIGVRDRTNYSPQHPSMKAEAVNIIATKTVKQASGGGIAYGELDPTMLSYPGVQDSGADDFGRVIKITQKVSFEVADGATSATVQYGDTSFGLEQLCRIFIAHLDSNGNVRQTQNQYGRNVCIWQFNIRTRLFTDGGR